LLDFGAGGKGYLIDIIGKIIEDYGITSFSIDGSGDILYKTASHKALRVGLENPQQTDEVLGVLPLFNQSVCGSAGNRRRWGKLHHIMNPVTLKPVENVLAVWVTAQQALLADSLSTC
jgi:thiamine biosynthesis lipoprotein